MTKWQRDFLSGLIEVKASPKVDVKQRKRIEMREINKSYDAAVDDFRLYSQQFGFLSEEVVPSYQMLKRLKRWGKMPKGRLDIPIICSECGCIMTKSYQISKHGDWVELTTFGVARKG